MCIHMHVGISFYIEIYNCFPLIIEVQLSEQKSAKFSGY